MVAEASFFRELFPSTQIPVILASVLEVSGSLRKKSDADLEDWITRQLYKLLIRTKAFRDGPLSDIRVHPEIPSPDPDSNSPGGVIDLLVPCGRGSEVYFAFEAKRLRIRNSSGKIRSGGSEYVDDGMMRFVTGQYAPFMNASAMLGYVFDGDIAKARDSIDKNVQSKASVLKLKTPKHLKRSKILPGKQVDETSHNLRNHSFTIYHLFLAV